MISSCGAWFVWRLRESNQEGFIEGSIYNGYTSGCKAKNESKTDMRRTLTMSTLHKPARTPKAQRWGNSLAVRLPASLLASSGISEGTPLEITNEGNGLLIRPLKKKKKASPYSNPYSEARLLEGLTPEAAHVDEAFEPTAGELGW
ncbi:MAG: antitoxin MazE [Motiliproteus sp.]